MTTPAQGERRGAADAAASTAAPNNIGLIPREGAAAPDGVTGRQPAEQSALPPSPATEWWAETFPNPPTASERCGHACGSREVRMIVAYDIANPRRLAQVAKHCEEHGVRVQYSVFECRLSAARFDVFWAELNALIEPAEDRLVAYRVCAECLQSVRTAGRMETTINRPRQLVFIF